jgi:hypothetical protein
MTTLNAQRVIIAVEVIAVCAITYVALELTRNYFGREGFWLVGLAGLFCALFGLIRLKK